MRFSRFWLAFSTLFFLLLSACSSKPPDAELESLSNLKGVSSPKLVVPSKGNCPIDDLRMPGEGWNARGSTGGLGVVNASYPGMPTSIDTPTNVGLYVQAQAAGTPSRNVAIVVVDDFSGVFTLGQDVFDLQNDSFDTSSPIVRAKQINIKLQTLVTAGELSHGALVFNHINALLVAGGYALNSFDTGTGIAAFTRGSQWVLVKVVDTQGFDTNLIATRVRAALNEMESPAINIHDIAINMSFAVVPCSVRSDFDANRANFPTFESYRDALLAANPGKTLQQIYNAIRTPVNGTTDPLYALINQLPPSGSTYVYVASAGNYGLNYPMYPAAWPQVISVSSHDVGQTKRSIYSNKGEIMIDGAWFSLTNPASINGPWGDAPSVIYAGTSFSAPAVAVFTAYDLANPTPQCALRMSTVQPLPDLAYGKDSVPNTWQNKRLNVAIPLYCGR
jgi:hypothetical protein